MKKPLVIIDSDSEVKDIIADLGRGKEQLEETLTFIKKQLADSWNKLVGCHWDRMDEVLKARGLLPEDYSKEKYSLAIRDGVLYLQDKKELPPELTRLLDDIFK